MAVQRLWLMQQLDINFGAGNTQQPADMEDKEKAPTNQGTGSQSPLLTDNRTPVDTGLRILFEELQHSFITRSRKDIAIELKKIENRTALLQDKINTLHSEVDRLSAIDLDTEFKRMQGVLVHISQGVNSINNSFSNSINGMGANMGDSLAATNEYIRKYADDAARQLVKLDEETKTNILFLEHKIQALADQNRQLRKGIRRNSAIQLIAFLLLLGAMAYLIAYQAGVRIAPVF